MSVTTVFVDRHDGTGADVTVDGTFVGAVVYVLEVGTTTWFAAGANAGPNHAVVALPLNLGSYYGTVYYSDNGVFQLSTAPSRFRVSDGTESVMWRILLAVQEAIDDLAVFASTSIVIQSVPYDRYMGSGTGKIYPFPCVIISPGTAETMNRQAGTNYRDDVGYPVRIDIVDNDNHSGGTTISDHLLARERIARFFRNQALSGVTEIYNCEAIPGPISDHTAFDKNLFVSTLTLRFISREIRGTY